MLRLTTLPLDIHHAIARFLSAADVVRLSQTCRALAPLARVPAIARASASDVPPTGSAAPDILVDFETREALARPRPFSVSLVGGVKASGGSLSSISPPLLWQCEESLHGREERGIELMVA
jgi:hypothetical protein